MTQTLESPDVPEALPGCHSISGDDLCAWCTRLLYHPGEVSLYKLSIQAMASGHPSVTGTITYIAVRNFSRVLFIPDITESSRSAMSVMLPAPDPYSPSSIHITRVSYTKALSQSTTSSACASEIDLRQLVAILIPNEQCISFWPQHFGLTPQWVTLESHVLGWMDRLCGNYCGGIWNLYTLNNGDAFMTPEPDDEAWVLLNVINDNRAEMSPRAAGIAACLVAYSHCVYRIESCAMTVHYYQLRDYALQHPECSTIMRIVDWMEAGTMQQLSFLPGEVTPSERNLIQRVPKTLDRHLHEPGMTFTSTRTAQEWLLLDTVGLECEEFRVLYPNNQSQLIVGETLLIGAISRTEVHPREVIKRTLHHNATAMVLTHNHPSGKVIPSGADRPITERLVQTPGLVDIRVPDHLIVGGSQVFSPTEHGLF